MITYSSYEELVSCSRLFCRGTEFRSPHGIPYDVLDRLLIIRTLPYTVPEMKQIIHVRSVAERITIGFIHEAMIYLVSHLNEISLDENAVAKLAEVADRTSLRYAIQLLTPARIISETRGGTSVALADIDEADSLFFDAKKSAKMLQESDASFLH